MKLNRWPFFLSLVAALFFLRLYFGGISFAYENLILGIVFLFSLSLFWFDILGKIVFLKFWPKAIMSFLAVLLLHSFLFSASIVFYKLGNDELWFGMFLVSILTLALWLGVWPLKSLKAVKITEKEKIIVFGSRPIFYFLYFALWVLALIFLFFSKESGVLSSPWQAINSWFLPIFFFLSLFVGFLIFSNLKTGWVLLFLVAHSFLAHLYLPAVHDLPWGGDVWRHLAIEEKIANEEKILPVLFGKDAEWVEVLNFDAPKIFLSPQKYSYGQLWGLNIFVAKIFNVNLEKAHIWLVPMIWFWAVPLLLFLIGKTIFSSNRYGLLLAWLSFLPFPFQALGSLTLPVSIGFISFLFAFLFWLLFWRGQEINDHPENKLWQKRIALFFTALTIFGYSLYFLILVALVLAVYIYGFFEKKRAGLNISAKIILFMCGVLFLPIIEILAKTSHLTNFNFVASAKAFLGQFSGWYFASAIRPHDILSGNIFFNHTPSWAFEDTIFTHWRWYVLPTMLLVWILIFAGLGFFLKQKEKYSFAICFLGTVVFDSYIIGWFLLGGERQIIRRLDLTLAFLLLLLIVAGFKFFAEKKLLLVSDKIKKISVLLFFVLFSFFASATFASGPDMRVVSEDEYYVAQKIWAEMRENTARADDIEQKFCAIADTWILLPLEAISARQVIGGGFPIDNQFGQKELLDLQKNLDKGLVQEVMKKASLLTGASNCFVVTDLSRENFFGDRGLKKIYERGKLILWRN